MSTFQLDDNRPHTAAQRKLQEIIHNSPQVRRARAFQKMADNHCTATRVSKENPEEKSSQQGKFRSIQKNVAQRYAYVDDKQVIEAYEGMEQYPNVMNDTEQVKNPTKEQSEAIGDRYYRKYKNRQEFNRHTTGQPVDVGLIDHLAKWYRLPFSNGFFVLGEAHNIANYRRLIKESNQTGDILGEGGTVPLLHYSRSQKQRSGTEPTRQVGQATEHAMESIVAKTAYALASLRDDLYRELWSKKSQTQEPATRFQDAMDWLGYVDAHKPEVKRDKRRRPYYMLNKVRMVLKPVQEAKEGEYERGKTAVNLLSACLKQLQDYQDSLDEQDLGVAEFQQKLKGLIVVYENYQYITPKEKRQLYWVGLKEAAEEAHLLARNEIEESTISRNGKSGKALIDEQAKENPTTGLLGETCTLRDIFMYEAIIDAQSRNFVMAGIGDDHLQHLKGPLAKVNILTISYKDFFDQHTIDAIHP